MSGEKFCYNPLCPQHVCTLYGTKLLVEAGNQQLELKQHTFIKLDGKQIKLCCVCAEVLNVIKQ